MCSIGEKGEDQPEDEGSPGPGARMQQGTWNEQLGKGVQVVHVHPRATRLPNSFG